MQDSAGANTGATSGANAAGGSSGIAGTGNVAGSAGNGDGTVSGGAATGGAGAAGAAGALPLGTGGDGAIAGASGNSSAGGAGGYSPCPPNGTPCVLMPLGDSITNGANADLPGPNGGYRTSLFHLALAQGQLITFVGNGAPNGPDTIDGVPFPKQNDGYGGYTIADTTTGKLGITSFTAEHIKTFKPNIVTLMIGANDVALSYDLANAPQRLATLIDIILGADPNLLLAVAQIIPSNGGQFDELAMTYNAAMPPLIKARADAGKHIMLVDMSSAFTSNPHYATEYYGDFLHPNEAGYAKLGATWYGALAASLR